MEDRLRKILNDKMEGISPTETAPQFSKAQTWDELSARLEAQPRRRVIPAVWLYAAAIIAGILFGGFGIHYLDTNKLREPVSAGTTKPQPAIMQTPAATKAAALTASSDKPAASRHTGNTPRRSALHTHPENDPQSVVKKQQITTKQNIDSLPAMTNVPAVAAAKPLPVRRAIHLLDIESEDKTVLTDHPAAIHTSTSFTIYISPSRLPDGKDAQMPSSVLRPFFR